MLAGGVAEPLALFGIVEQCADCFDEARSIEEVDRSTVHTILQNLQHRASGRTDQRAARRHRLKAGPGEYERVGEIDVDGGDTEKASVVTIGDASHEVDTLLIQAGTHLP